MTDAEKDQYILLMKDVVLYADSTVGRLAVHYPGTSEALNSRIKAVKNFEDQLKERNSWKGI